MTDVVLRPSLISGVGVFAARFISKNDIVRLFEANDCRWVNNSEVPHNEQQLHETYCVKSSNGYWCPLTFVRMSVGWYLNHSDSPNLRENEENEYYAIRDIQRNEELTIDYALLDDLIDNRPR